MSILVIKILNMKNFIILFALLVYTCVDAQTDKTAINKMLDSWHKAAADAKLNEYISFMTADAIYIGTDASENWNVTAFKAFCKPYFEKGTTWNFKAVQRNIYFNAKNDMAWFDELLDTHMKICRGSGVLKKENGQWKIAHYVLSMTVPNEVIDEVIKIKTPLEDAYMKTLQTK